MNKFFILALFLLVTLVFSQENVLKQKNTLSTVHDGETVLSTLQDGEVLTAKPEDAKQTSAAATPPGNYVPEQGVATLADGVPVFFARPLTAPVSTATSTLSDGVPVFFAGPLTAQVSESAKVLESGIEENEDEVTLDHEIEEANVEVHKNEDVLESTEDYKQTLAAAVNTARLLEVDAPEVLETAESLEAPTTEDEKMLESNEEESVVEEEPVESEVGESTD
jgi:hypothetical protein